MTNPTSLWRCHLSKKMKLKSASNSALHERDMTRRWWAFPRRHEGHSGDSSATYGPISRCWNLMDQILAADSYGSRHAGRAAERVAVRIRMTHSRPTRQPSDPLRSESVMSTKPTPRSLLLLVVCLLAASCSAGQASRARQTAHVGMALPHFWRAVSSQPHLGDSRRGLEAFVES